MFNPSCVYIYIIFIMLYVMFISFEDLFMQFLRQPYASPGKELLEKARDECFRVEINIFWVELNIH